MSMQRIQRTVAALVFIGAIASSTTGCSGAGGPAGMLLSLAIGLGVAVGTYYITNELIK